MSDREAFDLWWGTKYVSPSPEENDAWAGWQAALAFERAKPVIVKPLKGKAKQEFIYGSKDEL